MASLAKWEAIMGLSTADARGLHIAQQIYLWKQNYLEAYGC